VDGNGKRALGRLLGSRPHRHDRAAIPTADAQTQPTSGRVLATAVRMDRDVRWIEMARRLRRRLPGDARFGDPLSTAGQAPVELLARGVTTWRGEDSFVREIGLAGLQVWQSLSEAAGRGRGERELAILFTDLVGFSAWALKAGDAAALELLRAVDAATEGAVLAHQGRIVKRLGDGVMATFLSADAAVEAALDAQDAVRGIELDGYRPRIRAGVHYGRPRKLGGDYLGVDVNIAARVAEAAKAGELLASDAVLARLPDERLHTGRQRRLKAMGAPRELQVAAITRSAP
jgi:adenylate cyclase